MQLLPYQSAALAEVYQAFLGGKRSVVLQMPTGAGKTVVAAQVIQDAAVKRGRKVLFLTHRVGLVDQASEKLTAFGVRHGVMVGGRSNAPMERVQVACIPTLTGPGATVPVMEQWDLIVPDECHRGDADKVRAILPAPRMLGLTATPCDRLGRQLSSQYDHLVQGPPISALVAAGALVPPVVTVPFIRAGMELDALREAMTAPTVIDSYLDDMARMRPIKTVVFAASIKHADEVHAGLLSRGCKSVVVHSELQDREESMRDFEEGDADFLVNASVLVEGWDFPALQRVIMLRCTDSLPVYLQQVGRGVRPWCFTCKRRPGEGCAEHGVKRSWELHDYASNWLRHGAPFADRAWSLDGWDKAEQKTARKVGLWRCASCFYATLGPPPNKRCPGCGAASAARPMRSSGGRMIEATAEQLAAESPLHALRKEEQHRLGMLHRRAVGVLLHRGGMTRGRAAATAAMFTRIHKGDAEKVMAAVYSSIRKAP